MTEPVRRFWRRQSTLPTSVDAPPAAPPDSEAAAAADRSREELERVKSARPFIVGMAAHLRAERSKNHFAEMIEAAMRNRPAR